MQASSPAMNIGIDIGGTFTDFVIFYPETGVLESFKRLSTPGNPAQAVLAGLADISARHPGAATGAIIHGSTVATNALLERKGAVCALIATRGFRDVLPIGRQNRPELYDFFALPPQPLAPEHLRFEVDERVDARGRALTPLEPEQVDALAADLHALGVKSAAVCLLFSFLHPEHERMIGKALREAGISVSLSSDILPEYREYERTSTTVVNAYVSPVLDGYLAHLEAALATEKENAARLRVMQSNGGQIGLAEARRYGVRCILSGPAGGIVGARYLARLAAGVDPGRVSREASATTGAGTGDVPGTAHPPVFDPARLITFDMGGTSTDVSLIAGEPQITTESTVGGCPIRIPVLDIHTIGAGGGSIAAVDLGGALRVGPQSAGADPGPACYGRGDLPTVTDANLVLGRLAAERFLGGEMPLDAQRAWQALSDLGAAMGADAVTAALGVIEVVNVHMERALRLISVERGYDPGRGSGAPFTLISFGGAGGLHAADLARRLDIPTVLAPPHASTLSALGMLAAQVVKDYAQTVMLPGHTPPPVVEAALQPLAQRGLHDLSAEGLAPEDIRIERLVDLRYAGQSYELTVPYSPDLRKGFQEAHRRAYGYARPDAPMEIVNVRVRAVGKTAPPVILPMPQAGRDPSAAFMGSRPVILTAVAPEEIPFYRFESLQPGNRIQGPAVVVRSDTTFLLGHGDRAQVDAHGNLIVSVGA